MKAMSLFIFILCLGLLFTAPIAAQTTQPADEVDTRKAAEEALKELETEESTLIIPETKKVKEVQGEQTTKTVTIKPSVTSLEEERKTVPIRSEGQFILNKQVRLVALPAGELPWQITFEADKNGLADPPMYAIPSKLLEDLERITGGEDTIVAVVSGQVFAYKGTNYFLLTKVKPMRAPQNLDPGQAN